MAADSQDSQQIPPIVVGPGGNYAKLVETSLASLKDYRQLTNKEVSLQADLRRQLHPDIFRAVEVASDARSEGSQAFFWLVASEVERHLPGLAPALAVLWQHCVEQQLDKMGHCCVDEEGTNHDQ